MFHLSLWNNKNYLYNFPSSDNLKYVSICAVHWLKVHRRCGCPGSLCRINMQRKVLDAKSSSRSLFFRQLKVDSLFFSCYGTVVTVVTNCECIKFCNWCELKSSTRIYCTIWHSANSWVTRHHKSVYFLEEIIGAEQSWRPNQANRFNIISGTNFLNFIAKSFF